MNVLISAYACSPYDGSERAVGWNWICELNKYHKITALVSSIYRADIEDYRVNHSDELQNTKFIYVSVSKCISFWHSGYRGERIYYILWQRKAYKVAKALENKQHFDLVHHITYATCILPTYMHKLGVPFLYGPVSGGENIPAIIKYPLGKKGQFIELIRNASQIFFCSTRNFAKTMEKSNLILVTTEETKNLIPTEQRNKVRVFQTIGLQDDIFLPEPKSRTKDIPRILIAGRMIHWKGYELAIRSFIKALENGCKAELVILGDTDDGSKTLKAYLEKLCGRHLYNEIKFIPRLEHNKMKAFYDKVDILLNCSLRDSGCFVVMEAMSRGLPVICVNTGGPKVNTTDRCAIKIEPNSFNRMIETTADAIMELSSNYELRNNMGRTARLYALENFNANFRTKIMNEFYDEVVRNQSCCEKGNLKIYEEKSMHGSAKSNG